MRPYIIYVLSSLCRNVQLSVSEVVEENAIPCVNQAYYYYYYLKFEIHVVMHLSQRRLQTHCQNINSSTSMRWLFKGMGAGSFIGLLDVTPKTHLWIIKLLQTNLFQICARRKSNLSTVIIATSPQSHPQRVLRLALQTCVSDR